MVGQGRGLARVSGIGGCPGAVRGEGTKASGAVLRFRYPHDMAAAFALAVVGGTRTWENIVTACEPCNRRKGGRTPEEAGMPLLHKPTRPAVLPQAMRVQIGRRIAPDSWRSYLYWNVELV